jgi:photosystem II stability/assembly factor-like uncharacterized protein
LIVSQWLWKPRPQVFLDLLRSADYTLCRVNNAKQSELKMKSPRIFYALAAFVLLSSGKQIAVHAQTASNPHPQDQIAKMPVVALQIKDFKLLSSGTGWASTGNQLLFTTDNGAHWKDISPPNLNRDSFASVFFHDAYAGWVLLVGHPREGECAEEEPSERNWAFHVASTFDGGGTWTETHVKMPSCDSGSVGPSLNDNGNLTFADKLHGWLLLEHQSGSAFSFGSLFATSDEGRTWHEVKGPGFYGDIRAYPNGDIWVTGDPGANDEGNAQELVVSRDGGNNFEEVSLTAPKEIGPVGQPSSYTLPVFGDKLHGYEAASYNGSNGKKSTALLFETGDGGRTWRPDRILSDLAENETVANTVVGSTWIIPFTPQGNQTTLVKLRPNDRMAAASHKSSGDFNNCDLSFLTAEEGWMNCSGTLTSTINGGATWTAIVPRVRCRVLTTDPVTPLPTPKPLKTIEIKPTAGNNGAATVVSRDTSPGHIGYVSGIDQHLGFDKDKIIPVGDMATWWVSSPYYDVGIYLPHSPSGPLNPTLTSDWVDAVIGQGWGIIPIWSGLQPPCTVEPHKRTFSAVPDEAHKQGIGQAVKAYTSANALGLDGTIIYVDLEEYDHSKCGKAVKKYVKGWVEEMHTLGGSGSAGVYGNQDVAALDLTDADDGYITYADKRVTVWGLNHYSDSGLTDDLAWTNKQRVHQYQIDKYEKWGSAKKYKIDNDIVDARIVPSSGVKNYTFQAPVDINDGGIAGINNEVNNGAGLHMGTEIGPLTNSGEGGFGPGIIMSACGVNDTFIDSPLNSDTPIPLPAMAWNECAGVNGINNLGQVIGYDNAIGGFLYTPGAKPSLITLPGGIWPSSINDAGWIIGMSDSGCALTKPPYKRHSMILFDSIGSYGCPSGDNSDVEGFWGDGMLAINGLGQIVGNYQAWIQTGPESSAVTQATVFLDDVENGTPGASDNLSILATTQGNDEYLVSGINNNGQIAGTYLSYDSEGNFLPNQGFFINTDGSIETLAISTGPYSSISGINDDVQLAGGACSGTVEECTGWVGITVDTQH